MNDNLFDVPEQLSPKLQWMKAHNVTTQKHEGDNIANGTQWEARVPNGIGDTEDEAIVELAKANNWKLWNEL